MEPAPDFEGVEKRCFKGEQQISTFSVPMDQKSGYFDNFKNTELWWSYTSS